MAKHHQKHWLIQHRNHEMIMMLRPASNSSDMLKDGSMSWSKTYDHQHHHDQYQSFYLPATAVICSRTAAWVDPTLPPSSPRLASFRTWSSFNPGGYSCCWLWWKTCYQSVSRLNQLESEPKDLSPMKLVILRMRDPGDFWPLHPVNWSPSQLKTCEPL